MGGQVAPPLCLLKHPCTVAHDAIARAGGVAGIAEIEPPGIKPLAFGFDEKAGDGEETAGPAWAEDGPVAALYRFGGFKIDPPRRCIIKEMGEIGACDDQ